MGACEGKAADPEEMQEYKENLKLTKTLRREGIDNTLTQRLLLLGAGECGKSTIFKQLRVIHSDGFGTQERNQYAFIIHCNVIENMDYLITCAVLHIRTSNSLTPVSPNQSILAIQRCQSLLKTAFSELISRDHKSAIQSFTTAINEYDVIVASQTSSNIPQLSHILYSGRSFSQISSKHYNLALKDASKAIEISPEYPAAFILRALSFVGLKKYEQAFNSVKKAVETDSQNEHYRMLLTKIENLYNASQKLPQGWTEYADAQGKSYFHSEAGETTWIRPTTGNLLDETIFEKLDVFNLFGQNEFIRAEEDLNQPTLCRTNSKFGSSGDENAPVPNINDEYEMKYNENDPNEVATEWERLIRFAKTIQKRSKSSHRPFISAKLAVALIRIWEHECVQSAFANRAELRLQVGDSISYFMQNLTRVGNLDYIPDNHDIIMSRVRSTGISEMTFTYGQASFKIVDVGGQRSERRKWLHLFQDAQAVIFVAAMNEYDQVLIEDPKRNRIIEALELFEQMCNNQWLKTIPMILFLNKKDLFAEKIARVNLTVAFPEYTGGQDEVTARTFLMTEFAKRNQMEKDVFVHVTCATDTNNIQFVFEAVKDIVLQKNFKSAGF